jgi:hypothetical protein
MPGTQKSVADRLVSLPIFERNVPMMPRVTLVIAIFALLVNTPRLIQVFLWVDGLRLPQSVEAGLLTLSAIATGIVLSGGGAVLAHTLASSQHKRAGRGIIVALLVLIWLSMLAFSVILIAPMLVAGIRATEMVRVLPDERWQWLWAISAVLAVEVLAAGAMLAQALVSGPEEVPAAQPAHAGPSATSILTGALVRRLAASIEAPAPAPALVPAPAPAEPRTVLPAWVPPVSEPAASALAAPAPADPAPIDAEPDLPASAEPAAPAPSMPAPEPELHAGIACPQASHGCRYRGPTTAAVNAHQRFCKHKQNGHHVVAVLAG